MLTELHGRKVILINGRQYAVDDRNHGLAQRIHEAQRGKSTYQRWERSARSNSSKVLNRSR